MPPLTRQIRELAAGFVLGTNSMGWTADVLESHAILDRYREFGPGLLDSAEGYRSPEWAGPGDDLRTSEGVIGQWFRTREPAVGEMLVTTKLLGSLNPDNVLAAAQRSRDRLHVERIDVFYAHKDDPEVPLDETVSAFEELISRGTIGAVGLSMYTSARIAEWVTTADRLGASRPVAAMRRYNLIDRRTFEQDDLPVLERFDIAGFAYFVLASGLLTGKFTSRQQVEASDRARLTTLFASDEAFAFIPTLIEVAADLGSTPGAVATAWVASRPGIVAPVVGVRSVAQLMQAVEERPVALSPEVLRLLDAASAGFA